MAAELAVGLEVLSEEAQSDADKVKEALEALFVFLAAFNSMVLMYT